MNRYPPHHGNRYSNLGEALIWIVVLLALMILFVAFVWHSSQVKVIGW